MYVTPSFQNKLSICHFLCSRASKARVQATVPCGGALALNRFKIRDGRSFYELFHKRVAPYPSATVVLRYSAQRQSSSYYYYDLERALRLNEMRLLECKYMHRILHISGSNSSL